MHCFKHQDSAAVGLCKVCNRGLCPACAADLGHSLACKGDHERQAEAVNSLVMRNVKVQRTAGRTKYVAPVFYAAMGGLFLFFGVRHEGGFNFGGALGLGLLVFAAVVLLANLRAYQGSERDVDA